MLALAKLMIEKKTIPKPQFGIKSYFTVNVNTDPFPWFGALVWGLVLWLFEHHGGLLQPSLKSSMTYLYHDSDKWDSLYTLFWHNK